MSTHTAERNADTFSARTFWTAWPDNHKPADDFKLKREAAAYVAANGGGAIRKFTRSKSGGSFSTDMDCLEVPAC